MRPAILITGGGKRVGAVLSKHFARAGYDIALHYNSSQEGAANIQKELEIAGVSCTLFRCDLSDIAAIPALIADVASVYPHCNALINNASVFERCSFLDTDEDLFDRQLDINFKAPFFLTQAFVRQFGRGGIVNILDSNVVQTSGSHFAYLLSKKVLAEFTVMAARALGPDFTVNAVCPGCVIPSSENEKDYDKKMGELIPAKSHPTPEEVAAAAQWLLEQKHVTGQLIYVDGGKHVL